MKKSVFTVLLCVLLMKMEISVTTFTDFAMSIQVGPNNVPSNQFDVGWLHTNLANGGGVLMLPTPVLDSSNNRYAVIIEAKMRNCTGRKPIERTVVVDLIGELAIQKAPPGH